jgi:hypothetical protein
MDTDTEFRIADGVMVRIRVNLCPSVVEKSSPAELLYRIDGDTVRILVVRHHHRNPDHGLRRQ